MVKNAAVPLKNAKCQLMLQSSQFSNIQAESKLICHSLEIKTHWIKARDRQNVYIAKISVKSRSPIVMVSQLRTFAPIATAHRYSARKCTRHVMHRARALRNKINNDREDGHCYSFAWI